MEVLRLDQEFSVSKVSFVARRKRYVPGRSFRQEDRKSAGLVYVISGELTAIMEQETICVPGGSTLLLRQHDRYLLKGTASGNTDFIVISYFAEPMNVLQQLLPKRHYVTAYPQRYLDLFSTAVRLYADSAICSQTRLRANVQEILCCMIQEDYLRSLPIKENYAEKAMSFMENHFAESLSCEHIAQAVGISVSHLRLLFRKRYSTSLVQALNHIRIQRAKEMLSSGIFTLAEVAIACGFQNEYYFSRVFKQLTGISPGKY